MESGLQEEASRLVRERQLVLLGVMLADRKARTLAPEEWATLGHAYEDLTPEGDAECYRLQFLLRTLGVEWEKSMGNPIALLREHVIADAVIERSAGSARRMADFAAVAQRLDMADKLKAAETLNTWWKDGGAYAGQRTPNQRTNAARKKDAASPLSPQRKPNGSASHPSPPPEASRG
jgi:hypothetical protein